MNYFKFYFIVFFVSVSFFFVGYRVGDSSGYADGFEVGYRYDCKDEIGLIHSQVEAQSKALVYTDSALKRILRENDSLKRKEYYQKRYNDSITFLDRFSKDSLRYYEVSREYSDSLNLAVGGHVYNIIQPNGEVNRVCVLLPKYRALAECKDGFDLRSRLENKLKKKKGRKKK